MSSFSTHLTLLVRRRLARYLAQHSSVPSSDFLQAVPELVTILHKNDVSGRYGRFQKNERPRLTPTQYIDRVISNWVAERTRWRQLAEYQDAAWQALCARQTRAAELWLGSRRSLKGFTADDFAQQAMILMLRAEYPFDVEFEPWALTILHRVIFGRARVQKDVLDHQPDSFEELLQLGDVNGAKIEKQFADPLAHKFAQMLQDHELLQRALGQLQPTLRNVIELYYLEGLTNEEIARKLNTSVAVIYTRHHRALKRLRGLLTG